MRLTTDVEIIGVIVINVLENHVLARVLVDIGVDMWADVLW